MVPFKQSFKAGKTNLWLVATLQEWLPRGVVSDWKRTQGNLLGAGNHPFVDLGAVYMIVLSSEG